MASAAEQLAASLNFGAFAKAEELKKRLWFTLGALIVYRLGTYIPLPGIDPHVLNEMFQQGSSGILGMFDVLSGGALSRMTIFALTIMPYISASIIIQLGTALSPKLEALKKEGPTGRKVLNQYTGISPLSWRSPRLMACRSASRPRPAAAGRWCSIPACSSGLPRC
jgi:preprotein translocase subunit SecY